MSVLTAIQYYSGGGGQPTRFLPSCTSLKLNRGKLNLWRTRLRLRFISVSADTLLGRSADGKITASVSFVGRTLDYVRVSFYRSYLLRLYLCE